MDNINNWNEELTIGTAISNIIDLEKRYFILKDRIDKAIEVIDTQMKLAEDEAKDNLRIIKFYLIKGSCSMYDLTTEEDYKYKKGGNNEC